MYNETMFKLPPIMIGSKEILPIVEGGKGINISTGITAGAWALEGGIGTFSGTNPDFYNENGDYIPYKFEGKTRRERQAELIEQSIKGCVKHAEIARSKAPKGFINMNVLWEMGGCEIVLEETLKSASKLIDGITCGAGMPYKLAEICAKYGIFYFPIVSSARAFGVLWKRTYKNFKEFLGAVVYEDPWIAGGHNGLSSHENPLEPQNPYERIVELRSTMDSFGLQETAIIIAGGVWNLREWEKYIDNSTIGKVAFQFGTRPLITQESPISDAWKKRIFELKKGDVFLNKFSPTGFYSSGVYNKFLANLDQRSKRRVEFSETESEIFSQFLEYGPRSRKIYIKPEDKPRAESWIQEGFSEILKTPDNTIVFETTATARQSHEDQANCVGCLSVCRFSNWCQKNETTGKKPDPRSFCIQKTLQSIGHNGSLDDNLLFAGTNIYRFAEDPFYQGNFIPTVKELVNAIKEGR